MDGKASQWRVDRAALYGAILGPLFTVARKFIEGETWPYGSLAYTGGELFGAAAATAFLFALAAVVRNYFAK